MLTLFFLFNIEKYFGFLHLPININHGVIVPLKQFWLSCFKDHHEPVEISPNLGTQEDVNILDVSVKPESL